MTEAIEPTKKKKKKKSPVWIPAAPPSSPPSKVASKPDSSNTRPSVKVPGSVDSVRYADPADDNVFMDGAANGTVPPARSAEVQKFLDDGGDEKLAELDISEDEFARWVDTGEESEGIRAAREKMQAAKSDIREEMAFFRAALPAYAKAARARGDHDAANGADALRNKIGGYEAQAYRLWVDSTKANIGALRTMANEARTKARELLDDGDVKGAEALQKRAEGYERSAAQQSTVITQTLVARKESVKAQIHRTEGYDQRQRSRHTAYSDEIAELRTDDGLAEADAAVRHVERSKTNGYDPMVPQSIPSALGDHAPKGAFLGGAQHFLNDAESLDYRASESAGHISAVRRNGHARNQVATSYLKMNGYPPKKGTNVVVTPQTKSLMNHKVDGLITEQAAASKRIEQLEAKSSRSAPEEVELKHLRQDVMSLSTKIEATKQELSAQQMGPATRDKERKALDENIASATAQRSAASDELANLDKRRDEVAKYEHSDPDYFKDFEHQYAALVTKKQIADKAFDDAVAASEKFDSAIAGSNPEGVRELANVGAAVLVDAYRPPESVEDVLEVAGTSYSLAEHGPSTQDVLAPGVAAAEKIARPEASALKTPAARQEAFDDAEHTANFYAKASTLSKRRGRSTKASKELAGHAVERAGDVHTVLGAAKTGTPEKQEMAKRAVLAGTNVAVAISVDDPPAARAILETADDNVGQMAAGEQAEGHLIVGEGAAAHAAAVARRRPPPQDDATDESVKLGKKLLDKDNAPKAEGPLKERWKSAKKQFDYTARAPERHAKMIEKRREAAKRARQIALAEARWLTREGKSIADGSISYLADAAFYGSGPAGWVVTKPPSEMLRDAATGLAERRVKWIEDGFAKEMAALDSLEAMSNRAAANGRWGELMGALAASDAKAAAQIAGESPAGMPPVRDVVRFVQLDHTALGNTLNGSGSSLDATEATSQLARQTEATNHDADRAVGEARAHLKDLQEDTYFRYVPAGVAVLETAAEMIVTGGLSSSASLAKVGVKAAQFAKRAEGARKVLGGLQKIGSVHAKWSKASRLYGFGSKVVMGYALMEAQKATVGGLQGKVFKKGSFGEKAMNAGVGLVGDVGANRIAGVTDFGRKMVIPAANIAGTMVVAPYMRANREWSEQDVKKFTAFVEAATIIGGAAHGTYKERSAANAAPQPPTPDSVKKLYDQRVVDLQAKHPEIPNEVIRARVYREVRKGLDTFAGHPDADAAKARGALDAHVTESMRKGYAQRTAADLAKRASLTPAQAEVATPKIRGIVEAHQKRADSGEAPTPALLRRSLETELGKLESPDGTPVLTAAQATQIAKTAVAERTAVDALRSATDGSMHLESHEQLKKVVDHQEAALLAANEGRIPPLFTTGEIAATRTATVEGFIRNRAADRAALVANARKRAPSGRESVELVREEATALKAEHPTIDVVRSTAKMAIDVATHEFVSTRKGRKMVGDPGRVRDVEARIAKRAVDLGADPEAVRSILSGETTKSNGLPSQGPDSIVVMKRVEDSNGRPVERDGGWVFEEKAGYELLGVNETANTATVRQSDGKVRDVSLDDVVFEHHGVTFGAATPLEMRRLRERYDALSPADQKRWQNLMGEARKVSPEHAALARRMFASGESVDTVKRNFDRYEGIPRKDLAKVFSMENHVQHYKDSCAAAGGCQTPIGWVSPMMGEAITKYPTAVAEQQRRDVAHANGASEPRQGTPDYTGQANLDPNAYIPAPPKTASAESTAALTHLNRRAGHDFDRHHATRLDANHAPGQIHDLLSNGQKVYVTMKHPRTNAEYAVELTGPHAHADGPRVGVRSDNTYSARLEVRYEGGQQKLTLGGTPLTAVAVPKGASMRGNRQGMFFTSGRFAVHDLQTATGKTYHRRPVAAVDAHGNVIPDAARTRAAVDQTTELAKKGYPVMLEVEWQGSGGRHQIAVKPGTRKNKYGETEMFVHDPWISRGRWMTAEQLAAYQLGAQRGDIVAMGVPEGHE